MAKRIINGQQIVDVIWGATLLGGGGGGSIKGALDLLNKYRIDHPKDALEITLYDYAEMEPEAYAAATAAMGAPTAFQDVDLLKYFTNSFVALQEMAAKMDTPKELKYSYGVELGGTNTLVPMMVSLVNKIPFIDGDGAGRAVPALDTLLLNINGCDTAPLTMSDGKNNRLTIELADTKDARLGEEIGRHICEVFNQVSGVSGWMVRREDFEQRLVIGSITLAEKVGRVLRTCSEYNGDVFAVLTQKDIVNCKFLGKGKVIKIENVMKNGYDFGKVVIAADGEFTIFFQNENLLISKNGKPMMTVPDIICYYDVATGMPLSNADINEGMEIVIGAVKVDEKWWKNPNMFDFWEPLLESIGYTGGNIPYIK